MLLESCVTKSIVIGHIIVEGGVGGEWPRSAGWQVIIYFDQGIYNNWLLLAVWSLNIANLQTGGRVKVCRLPRWLTWQWLYGSLNLLHSLAILQFSDSKGLQFAENIIPPFTSNSTTNSFTIIILYWGTLLWMTVTDILWISFQNHSQTIQDSDPAHGNGVHSASSSLSAHKIYENGVIIWIPLKHSLTALERSRPLPSMERIQDLILYSNVIFYAFSPTHRRSWESSRWYLECGARPAACWRTAYWSKRRGRTPLRLSTSIGRSASISTPKMPR